MDTNKEFAQKWRAGQDQDGYYTYVLAGKTLKSRVPPEPLGERLLTHHDIEQWADRQLLTCGCEECMGNAVSQVEYKLATPKPPRWYRLFRRLPDRLWAWWLRKVLDNG